MCTYKHTYMYVFDLHIYVHTSIYIFFYINTNKYDNLYTYFRLLNCIICAKKPSRVFNFQQEGGREKRKKKKEKKQRNYGF